MSQSTGCSQPELLERLYHHFAHPSAWDVYPGAQEALKKIRSTGTPHLTGFPTSPAFSGMRANWGHAVGVHSRAGHQE